jgi:1-acyl-sn-glycerol-3-phosphate acyltransferase
VIAAWFWWCGKTMRLTASVIFRNVAFYAAAAAMTVAMWPIGALPYLGLMSWDRMSTLYLGMIAWLLKRICRIDVEVAGMETIPAGPVIFAPAQQCTWENLYFPIMFGNPVMLIKNEIKAYPIVSRLARERGYIYANRGRSTDEIRSTFIATKEAVAAGRSVMMFPTGWRTGNDLSPPLQNGIAIMYRMLDVPCVPIAHNAGLCWPHKSWLRLPGTISVRVLPAIPAGLSKEAFLDRLHAELFGATDDLLAPPSAPAPMPAQDSQAAALAKSISAEAGL